MRSENKETAGLAKEVTWTCSPDSVLVLGVEVSAAEIMAALGGA